MFLYIFSTIHSYLSLLFSYFVFLFSPSFSLFYSPQDTFYNLQYLIRFHYNQNNYSNLIFGLNYELFLPLYQITFFLDFGQAKIFFSYHILMNILIYILFCDKKILLTIFHTEKHFKIRKEYVLINVF